MKTKILTLLTVFMLLAPTIVTAASTFTVNYNVQTTSFAVEVIAAGQTDMNFTGGPNTPAIKPEGSDGNWGKINNTGDTTLSFNITVPTQTDITLRVGSSATDMPPMTGSPVSPSGWANVVSKNSVNIYAEADFAANAAKVSTTATIEGGP